MDETRELVVEIKNEQGLHARPTGLLVKLVRNYNSKLIIINEDNIDYKANGSDLMDVMSLGAQKGQKLILRASGADSKELLQELQKLIEVDMFFE